MQDILAIQKKQGEVEFIITSQKDAVKLATIEESMKFNNLLIAEHKIKKITSIERGEALDIISIEALIATQSFKKH